MAAVIDRPACAREPTLPPRQTARASAARPNSISAAGFFSLAISRWPPASITAPSPREPSGSDQDRAKSPLPSTIRWMDAMARERSAPINSARGGDSCRSSTRPGPSAQMASICGSDLGNSDPGSDARHVVCHSSGPSSGAGRANQASLALWSPMANSAIFPFGPRRRQMPETSRSGTSTTRLARKRSLAGFPFFGMRWLHHLPPVVASICFCC